MLMARLGPAAPKKEADGMDFETDEEFARESALKRRLSRRSVLQFGAVGAASLLIAPQTVFAADKPRSISFDNLHTGETLKTTYWADGGYVRDALKEIDWVLRDFRTGDIKAIDPGLLDILNALHKQLDSTAPYGIISGYRSPATNAMLHENSNGVATKSLHMRGMAIDVRLGDRALKDLHKAALSLKAGGVGYYPRSNFVHLDTGRVRHWG